MADDRLQRRADALAARVEALRLEVLLEQPDNPVEPGVRLAA